MFKRTENMNNYTPGTTSFILQIKSGNFWTAACSQTEDTVYLIFNGIFPVRVDAARTISLNSFRTAS